MMKLTVRQDTYYVSFKHNTDENVINNQVHIEALSNHHSRSDGSHVPDAKMETICYIRRLINDGPIREQPIITIGYARCSKLDNPNKKEARILSFERALGEVHKGTGGIVVHLSPVTIKELRRGFYTAEFNPKPSAEMGTAKC